MRSFTSADLADLFARSYHAHIGLDNTFDRMAKMHDSIMRSANSNYPPYNTIKTGENTYVVELAVAGFSEAELDITLDESILTITGKKDPQKAEQFVYQGIANRSFERKLILGDDVVVRGATLENGMLRIDLERIVPEDKKPKKISINTIQNNDSTRQYLEG